MKKKKQILYLEKSKIATLNALLLRGGISNADPEPSAIPITDLAHPCSDACATGLCTQDISCPESKSSRNTIVEC